MGALCLATLSAAAAVGETISQTVPFDYDATFGATLPVIEGFDTQGGARRLTGVTFDFHHNFSLDLFIESTGPTPVAAGDFSLELSYPTLFQLGPGGGETEPPFLGPGAMFFGGLTGALGAYDGDPGSPGADSFRRQLRQQFTVTQVYGLAEPEVLEAVTDVGPLTTVLGGFTELFFSWINDPNWPVPPSGVPQYPTDAALWVSLSNFRHFGDITITYEYAQVPEPATALLLAPLALLSARRRGR